jgi:4-amino-4-deoxy-L-arabinose transferase-like glycosyltransferase
MSTDSASYRAPLRARRFRSGAISSAVGGLRARPELAALFGLAAVLNLWGLSINGWANTYYSAAVRSMTTSWHDFLFASLDKTGLMTVDKPPLSLWVQALSARVFGFHPLSILVPQALMGVAATGLIYDLTRRRFGRPAGFAAGLALATTPVVVAVSRHNNPDELLVLCCVAALWCALRALDTGRTKWLVLSGVCVGLGFETKMGVALMMVPGIVAAYLWVAPSRQPPARHPASPDGAARESSGCRLKALRQLLAGGVALAVVGLAWPVLVTLTPAADRPWISGTSDNSIWSLIFSYNGVGRIAGQSGGPAALGGGGGGGGTFGGATGVFRLLQSSLGDQAGWLLGFALVAGAGVLVASRLRRRDPRTGWLIMLGGAFLTTAIVFSFAKGIFHPYYVSLLAPFTAALIGAGVGQALSGDRTARIVAPLAIAAGAITELVVLGTLGGQLSWAKPLVIAVAILSALALALQLSPRIRAAVLAVALAALFAAPATWAAETLGHATSGTFPTGGPASALTGGFGGPPGAGGRGGFGRGHGFFFGGGRGAGGPGGAGTPSGAGGAGTPSGAGGAGTPSGAGGAGTQGGVQSLFRNPSGSTTRSGAGGFAGRPSGAGGFGGFGGPSGGPGGGGGGIFGSDSPELAAAIKYAKAHGGGTIGVSSQSSAAAAILSSNANVAGLGGFSGRESSVSAAWIAMEVSAGHLRWVIVDGSQDFRATGDTRTGSQSAMDVVAKTCRKVTFRADGTTYTMYDCLGRASAILAGSGK